MRTSLLLILFILVFALAPGVSHGQEVSSHRLYDATPHLVVKSNLFSDLLLSLNLGVELKLNQRLTLDVPVHYNPFTFADNRKWKHILVQPEVRYWLCEAFAGHFLGLHGHYADFNVGNVGPLKATRNHRYRGNLVGAGLSWGHHWLLNPRWSLEATIGFGYAYIDYSKHEYGKCGPKVEDSNHHYLGITKLGISLVYTLR